MKNTSLSLPYFNSRKVRLESASAARLTMFLYFNFIKVRLELVHHVLIVDAALEFQFHKGAIRTTYSGTLHIRKGISIP